MGSSSKNSQPKSKAITSSSSSQNSQPKSKETMSSSSSQNSQPKSKETMSSSSSKHSQPKSKEIMSSSSSKNSQPKSKEIMSSSSSKNSQPKSKETMSSSSSKKIMGSSTPKEVRNLLELPSELMFLIFTKVDTIDIIRSVQFVCSTWRNLCKEPHLFRSIHISSYHDLLSSLDIDDCSDNSAKLVVNRIVKEAVNRSCGQLVDFSIYFYATDELLEHITAKRCPLRRLRLEFCPCISDSAVTNMAKNLPLLEELEMCDSFFRHPEEVINTFGQSCLLLKSFRLNYGDMHYDPTWKACDKEALAIAQSMPKLRHLDLTGTQLTNNGLLAILDRCAHLNFLDVSRCPYLNYGSGNLVKICVYRNIELRVSAKATLLFELITETQRNFSRFLTLQSPTPDYECIEAGHDEELDAAYSLYAKALNQTMAQIRSQYDTTLSPIHSHILSLVNRYSIQM